MVLNSRYPFLVIAIAFAGGVAFARWQNLPFHALAVGLLACFPFLWLIRRRWLFLGFFVISIFVLGCMHGTSSIFFPQNHLIHGFPSDVKVVCQGRVTTLPFCRIEGKKHTLRFRMRLENIYHRGVVESLCGDVQAFHYGQADDFSVGDCLRIRGVLSHPRQASNPGQLDYRRYLKGEGVYAVLRSFGSYSISVIDEDSGGFTVWVAKARRYLKERINKIMPFPENELLSALLIGERSGIPHDLRNLFVQTGTIHLLAISGLHVSLIIGFFYTIQRLCGLPQKLNAAISILLLFIYVALAGSRPSTQRAGLMGVLFLTGILLERRGNLLNAIAMAFFFMLLMRPPLLYQPGFQLSFVTITSIVLLAPRLDEYCTGWLNTVFSESFPRVLRSVSHFLMRMVIGTASAMVGAFPFVAYYFHLFSPIGLFANVIAVPVILAGLIIGIFSLVMSFVHLSIGSWLGLFAVAFFRLAEHCLKFFLLVPGGTFSVSGPHVAVFFLYYGTVLWLFYGKTFFSLPRRWCIALFVWVGIASAVFLSSFKESVVITFLDVGRAHAAHVSFNDNEHWLINGGRGFPSCNGRWIIAPYLRYQAVQRLVGILTTSSRANNWGGLQFVTSEFACDYFFLPPSGSFSDSQFSLIGKLKKRKTNVVRLDGEDRIQHGSGGPRFTILSDKVYSRKKSGQHHPMAVCLAYGEFKALFIPDGDSCLLKFIASAYADEKYDLVWLPKHGRWVSDEEISFLERTRPKFVVVSGKTQDIDSRISKSIQSIGSKILDTECLGAISVSINENGIRVSTFREGIFSA